MTGILQKFYVQQGIHGAKVMARSQQLTRNCITEGEINAAIQALKDDLDACAQEMRRRVAIELTRSTFEGWANDLE